MMLRLQTVFRKCTHFMSEYFCVRSFSCIVFYINTFKIDCPISEDYSGRVTFIVNPTRKITFYLSNDLYLYL